MTQQKEEIPQKTGEPSFQYEAIVGKSHYRWETYISNGPQAVIAAGLHKVFADVFHIMEFHIMDIGEGPPLPEDLILEAVRVGPWRQTVESHLT